MEPDKVPILSSSSDLDDDFECEYKAEEKKELSVDDILLKSGPFGRYQLWVLCFAMIASLGYSFQTLVTYFTADDCPWICSRRNVSEICPIGPFKEGTRLFPRRCKLPREDWRYLFQKDYSIVTEYDLICSKEYLRALVTSCFFIGCCVGSIVAGPLADSFGRKPIIILSFVLSFSASIAGYFVAAVWEYLALRVVIGFAFGHSATAVFIYLSENNPPKSRGWVGNIYFIAFTVGMLLLTLIAYYAKTWRKIVLYTSFFPLLALIFSLFLYESPHWLVVNGKHDKAVQVLKKICNFNKKSTHFILEAHKKEEKKHKRVYSYIDLVNNLKVLVLTTVQCYLWLVVGLSFYAIALEASDLGGDLYTNFILSSLADLPGCLIAVVLSIYVSRKKSVGVALLIGGSLCGTIGFISERLVVVRVILAMFSRMFLSIGFDLLFLWSFEINPTVIRTQGMNIAQLFSRLGSIAAPFFTSVLQDQDPKLPFFIIAGFCLLGTASSFLLPETLNKPTREDYDDYFEKPTTVTATPPTQINEI